MFLFWSLEMCWGFGRWLRADLRRRMLGPFVPAFSGRAHSDEQMWALYCGWCAEYTQCISGFDEHCTICKYMQITLNNNAMQLCWIAQSPSCFICYLLVSPFGDVLIVPRCFQWFWVLMRFDRILSPACWTQIQHSVAGPRRWSKAQPGPGPGLWKKRWEFFFFFFFFFRFSKWNKLKVERCNELHTAWCWLVLSLVQVTYGSAPMRAS